MEQGAPGGLVAARHECGIKLNLQPLGVMTDSRMPALYIGHGAPPLLDDPMWSGQLAAWAAGAAAPDGDPDRQRPLGVGAGEPERRRAPLVYDFGGFDAKYYRMTYETPPPPRSPSGSRR